VKMHLHFHKTNSISLLDTDFTVAEARSKILDKRSGESAAKESRREKRNRCHRQASNHSLVMKYMQKNASMISNLNPSAPSFIPTLVPLSQIALLPTIPPEPPPQHSPTVPPTTLPSHSTCAGTPASCTVSPSSVTTASCTATASKIDSTPTNPAIPATCTIAETDAGVTPAVCLCIRSARCPRKTW
jgi:hypothetical protein